MTAHSIQTSPEPVSAILVSVHAPPASQGDVEASIGELTHLLAGLGVSVVACLRQHRAAPLGAMVLGQGKLEELTQLIADTREHNHGQLQLVFDGDLTPGQQRHLARETGVPVIDRTQLILRVFAQRARTRTARLEIEVAALEYELPRVRDEGAVISRQGGGGGRAGRGDTSVELRKQELRRRLAVARAELVRASSVHRARQRRRCGTARVALVGYTNAGKSSWMRALTGSEVAVEDALFVTLDTTVRALHPPTIPPLVVADTVGFLRRLPNHLIASFRSTLEEALDAELLLILVDGADPEWREKLAITRDVLQHVSAEQIPALVLVNKRDRMSLQEQARVADELPNAPCVSARSPDDVATVHGRIADHFSQGLVGAELHVPFSEPALQAEIWDRARVVTQRHDETGAHLQVRAEAALVARWQARLRA